MRAVSTGAGGISAGQVAATAGAWTRVAGARQGAVGCGVGTSFSHRVAIKGVVA